MKILLITASDDACTPDPLKNLKNNPPGERHWICVAHLTMLFKWMVLLIWLCFSNGWCCGGVYVEVEQPIILMNGCMMYISEWFCWKQKETDLSIFETFGCFLVIQKSSIQLAQQGRTYKHAKLSLRIPTYIFSEVSFSELQQLDTKQSAIYIYIYCASCCKKSFSFFGLVH